MTEELKTLQQEVEQGLEKIQDSMTRDDSVLEEAGWTTDINEWINVTKQVKLNNLNFDYEIIKNAEAYLISPVFKYKEKVGCASILRYKSLNEIKEYLKNKKYLLYMLITTIVTAKTKEDNKFEFVPLEEPEFSYLFRGYILS